MDTERATFFISCMLLPGRGSAAVEASCLLLRPFILNV